MKLFGSSKSKITKDKNGENVSYYKIIFVPNKSFGQL